jgi:DNA-binding XRE family transcriptional regulator
VALADNAIIVQTDYYFKSDWTFFEAKMIATMTLLGPIGEDAVMDLKAFGARLKELREMAGLSQKELAEKAGLSQKAVSHWELGSREPGLFAAQALAEALGVDLPALLEEPTSQPDPRGRGRPPKAAELPEPKRKGKAK